MNRPGYQLFANTRFSPNQNGCLTGSRPSNLLVNTDRGLATANNLTLDTQLFSKLFEFFSLALEILRQFLLFTQCLERLGNVLGNGQRKLKVIRR